MKLDPTIEPEFGTYTAHVKSKWGDIEVAACVSSEMVLLEQPGDDADKPHIIMMDLEEAKKIRDLFDTAIAILEDAK